MVDTKFCAGLSTFSMDSLSWHVEHWSLVIKIMGDVSSHCAAQMLFVLLN
jgi:hypothetical protein